jgi:energy-coupling factor transporter ATP-binding protein EcfA2
VRVGPVSAMQMKRLGATWRQGGHVLITGGTGSGKTLLARQVIEQRIIRDGYVVVFVCKLQPDETIRENYKGFTRWKTWKRRPGIHEQKILFWPAVEGLPATEAVEVFRREFRRALDEISRVGKWCVVIDEGLFVSSSAYLGLSDQLGMMYQLMRSAKGTMVTLAQRPAHLPVAIYANIEHAFVGRASELPDLKRLADLDGPQSSRELQRIIASNGRHDFTWIPVGPGWPPEQVNLRR